MKILEIFCNLVCNLIGHDWRWTYTQGDKFAIRHGECIFCKKIWKEPKNDQ